MRTNGVMVYIATGRMCHSRVPHLTHSFIIGETTTPKLPTHRGHVCGSSEGRRAHGAANGGAGHAGQVERDGQWCREAAPIALPEKASTDI